MADRPTRPRREATGSDVFRTLFDFDLVAAAYHWDPYVIWQVTGYSPDQLRAMRNHEISVPTDLKQLTEELWTLHFELWLAYPQPWNYAEWWQKPWSADSALGSRSPLTAIGANPVEAIKAMIGHYQGLRSGDFS